jgi:hypothetical protein
MGDPGAIRKTVDAVVDAVNEAEYGISVREHYSTALLKSSSLDICSPETAGC